MGKRVNQSEFAKIANVNKSTVSRWIKAGRIKIGGDGLLDVDEGLRQRSLTESPEPHHQAAKARIDEDKAYAQSQGPQERPQGPNEEGAASKPLNQAELISIRLKMATMKEREAKAEMANLELDKAAGLLIERSEIEFVLTDIAKTFAEKLATLADRYSPACASHRGDVVAIHKELDDAAHDLLADISEHMRRKADTF